MDWHPDSYNSKGMAARSGPDMEWAWDEWPASQLYLGEPPAENEGPLVPFWETASSPASCPLPFIVLLGTTEKRTDPSSWKPPLRYTNL